jgi:16S rRNA processing protein RimM
MMHANKNAQQPPEYLVVGRIIRPHSMRGALIVEAHSALIRAITPGTQIFVGNPPSEVKIEDLRPHRDRYLMTLAGCTTRDHAEHFRGAEIRLRFDDVDPLPEGEYYHWQILGLQVSTLDGQFLGQVSQILETGANDVYIIRNVDGKEQLLPAIKQVIKAVDLEAGKLIVELLPGLLDD